MAGPQRQDGAGDTAARLPVRSVVEPVDAGARPVVLTDGMDDAGLPEAAPVFIEGSGVDRVGIGAPSPNRPAQILVGSGADQGFRQPIGLRKEKPMVHRQRHGGVHHFPHIQRRHHVQHRQPRYPVRMVQRQTIGHPAAPVMPGHGEAVEAELRHQLDHRPRHGALGIIAVRAGRSCRRSPAGRGPRR